MNEILDDQLPLFASLPPLTEQQIRDAKFRGKDLAWSLIAGLFDERAEIEHVTYKAVGDRIGKGRSEIQRWLDSPHNMTIQSFSLLAEALDADLIMRLVKRVLPTILNECHPSDEAAAYVDLNTYLSKTTNDNLPASGGSVYFYELPARRITVEQEL